MRKSDILLIFVFSALVVAPHLLVAESGPCTAPGARPATAEDDVVKSGRFKVGDCYNPSDESISSSAEQGRDFLKNLNSGGRYSKCSNPPSIDQQFKNLNGTFSNCAAQFLKAYQQKTGAQVSIRRAWNHTQCEAEMCRNNPGCGALNNNPNPVGNHTRGLAIDITSSRGQPDIMAFSRANPQFGICFPFTWDTVHMILKGAQGSEGGSSLCAGIANTCSGTTFDPRDVKDPRPGLPPGPTQTSQPTTPTQNMMNAFRNFINPPPPPPPPVSQPLPPTQNPNTYAQPVQPVSSSIGQTTPTSPADSGKLPPAALDLINAITRPTSTTPASTPKDTLVLLVSDIGNTSSLSPTNANNKTSDVAVKPVDSSFGTGQTFSTNDATFAGRGFQGNAPTVWRILEAMRQTLLAALNYLRPFGGRTHAHPQGFVAEEFYY